MVELSDKWLQRLMALAVFISDWSKDPSSKIGAVISEGNRIVSVGYNGFPRGIVDDVNRLNDRQTRLKYTIHAELNAILQARETVRGYYLFTTHYPCSSCAQAIVQAGISQVYYLYSLGRWNESEAAQIFKEAKVLVKQVDLRRSDDLGGVSAYTRVGWE